MTASCLVFVGAAVVILCVVVGVIVVDVSTTGGVLRKTPLKDQVFVCGFLVVVVVVVVGLVHISVAVPLASSSTDIKTVFGEVIDLREM